MVNDLLQILFVDVSKVPEISIVRQTMLCVHLDLSFAVAVLSVSVPVLKHVTDASVRIVHEEFEMTHCGDSCDLNCFRVDVDFAHGMSLDQS